MMLSSLVMLVAAAAFGDPPTVTVRCRAEAELRGSDVLLRDLAEITCEDGELVGRLLQVPFGSRPAAGFTRLIGRQDVLLRLVREGLPAAQLRVVGAEQIVLQPIVTILQPKDLLEVAEPLLRGTLERDGGDVEYELASKLSSVSVPPGRFSMEVTGALASGGVSWSAAAIDLSVRVDDAEYKVLRVPFRLHRFTRVLTTTRVVKRGEPLGVDNVELRRVEAQNGASPYLSEPAALEQMVAARDLRSGQMLTAGAISLPAVVYRGDVVHLVAESNGIRVATRALALADGAVGERVQVRNLTSDKVIQAVVHGQGLVVVPNAASAGRQP